MSVTEQEPLTADVLVDPVADRETPAAVSGPPEESEPVRRSSFSKFLRDPVAVAASLFLLLCVAVAVLAPVIAPYDPDVGSALDRLKPIGTPGHVLGTDEQGRDMLTRVMYGMRVTLFVGVLSVVCSGVIGVTLGVIAGYFRRGVNNLVMRTLDVFYAFPAIILAIAIEAALGPGLKNALLALPFVFAPPIARVVETSVQQVKRQQYFEAAYASGAGDWMIIRYHLMGNILRPVLSYVSSLFGLSIIVATGLAFLGLGVQPPTADLGSMLQTLQGSIYLQPMVAIVPGLAIFLIVLAFNLLSDSLQDIFDSRV